MAREYRDQLLAQLPPARKRTFVLNTTGEVGVARVKERTRAGTLFVRYVASWPTASGARAKASFSVSFYGEAAAKRRAVQARRRGLDELLRPRSKSLVE
jgi:hypothetical protein